MDIIYLFLLGILGWGLFSLIHSPVPPLLGPIILIGGLKIAGFQIPTAPDYLYTIVQVVLGLSIGSKITKETIEKLREMVGPAIIIIIWTLSVAFLVGGILSRVTYLDLYTAVLASSMGGVAEITLIAIATGANVPVIIVMKLVRMVSTTIYFPIIYKKWVVKNESLSHKRGTDDSKVEFPKKELSVIIDEYVLKFKEYRDYLHDISKMVKLIIWGALALLVGFCGGLFFLHLGVPAGALVGSIIFTGGASLVGMNIKAPPPKVLAIMLVGVAIVISDSITVDSMQTILSGNLIIVILIFNVITFLTSLLVANIIHRVFKWDYPTSFLAAAPGGLIVMTSLAVQYKRNPFQVSMLHLIRVLAIKIVVPLVFMFLL